MRHSSTYKIKVMKRCFLLLLLSPLLVSPQVRIKKNPKLKQNIEGVGNFKIDKTTTAVIDSIAKQNNITVKQYDKYLGGIVDLENPEGYVKYIVELKGDSRSMGQENVRIFYLNFINVGGVDIRNIYLEFYKDTLFKFSSESAVHNSELSLSEAFELKYGKPTLDQFKKTPVVCQNGFGATFNYENWDFYKVWLSIHGNVAVTESSIISYNECKQSSFYSFDITDKSKEQKIASIALKTSNTFEDLKNKRKRILSKDF